MYALKPNAVGAVAVALILAACGGDRPSAPANALPPEVSLAAVAGPSCTANVMHQHARDYINNQDIVHSEIDQLFAVIKAGGTLAAKRAEVIDIWQRIAAARRAGLTKAASFGDLLARDGCLCGQYTDCPSSFLSALSTGGLFEAPALSSTAALTSFGGTLLFGLQPDGSNSWGSHSTSEFLAWGAPIQTFGYLSQVATPPFEIDIVGTTFSPPPIAGVCVQHSGKYRLQHKSKNDQGAGILGLAVPTFCPQPSTASTSASLEPLALGKQILALLAPKPLYAAQDIGFLGTGGKPSDFSPFGGVDGVSLEVAYTSSIPDGTLTNGLYAFTVTVRATVAGAQPNQRVPLPDVTVTMSVTGNQGGFALGGVTSKNTDANGLVTFSLTLDKTGQYVLTATGAETGYNQAQALTQFHIRGN